ncbi:HI0074 family nucleotidyltransferase substrate-binding subunit [Hippea jasoniae]|uniref:HI0074 family nucleotidyltransferase substrate-binding subunit n=1 Tax=Hippea jasoniae TaxID=944479 RepID=UPI000556235B|nr:HI0074 family nucleotidyltransferase substrate-binding subunit [Hippea jasoniae]
MKKSEVLLKINTFEKALNRLKEAVNHAKDDLDKDGVIQRFEFTTELLWKTLKTMLQFQGIDCYSPRNCIKEAFKANIIDDDEIILDILEDRNLSSHLYDQRLSEEIFQRIKDIYVSFLDNLNLSEKV